MYDRVDRLTRSTKLNVDARVAAGQKGEKLPGGFSDKSSRVMSGKAGGKRSYKARVHVEAAEALIRERSDAALLHKGFSAAAVLARDNMRRQH